jgi:hypothetical protein
MIIDQKQIFWKMQHCYALIPIIQLLDGRNYLCILYRCTINNKSTSLKLFLIITCINIRSLSNNKLHLKIPLIFP